MIAVEVSGGLGNQFFRYAFARNLYKLGGEEKLVLNTRYINRHGFSGDINDFHIMCHSCTSGGNVIMNNGNLKQKILFIIYTALKRMWGERIEMNGRLKKFFLTREL